MSLANWEVFATVPKQPLSLPEPEFKGKKGTFKKIYGRIRFSLRDREFAALVAVYRLLHLNASTNTRDITAFAQLVKRDMSNPSVSIKEAKKIGDLRRVYRTGPAKFFSYKPTEQGTAKWEKRIKRSI